jgi:hypothetical protein
MEWNHLNFLFIFMINIFIFYLPAPSANLEATVDVQDQQIPTTFDFATEHKTQSLYTEKSRHHGELT